MDQVAQVAVIDTAHKDLMEDVMEDAKEAKVAMAADVRRMEDFVVTVVEAP
jgi:hypothetical protein